MDSNYIHTCSKRGACINEQHVSTSSVLQSRRLVALNLKTKRKGGKGKLVAPIERSSGSTTNSKHSGVYTLYATTAPARGARPKAAEKWNCCRINSLDKKNGTTLAKQCAKRK
jgi:hypothetical protein